jgi:hypothetical protein
MRSSSTDHQRVCTRSAPGALPHRHPHLRETGRYTQAEQIILQALALCDPADPLYIEWARLELARGRPERIPTSCDASANATPTTPTTSPQP